MKILLHHSKKKNEEMHPVKGVPSRMPPGVPGKDPLGIFSELLSRTSSGISVVVLCRNYSRRNFSEKSFRKPEKFSSIVFFFLQFLPDFLRKRLLKFFQKEVSRMCSWMKREYLQNVFQEFLLLYIWKFFQKTHREFVHVRTL